MIAGPYRALRPETRRKGEDNMRKTATVIGLLVAAAAFTWANAATVSTAIAAAAHSPYERLATSGGAAASAWLGSAVDRITPCMRRRA